MTFKAFIIHRLSLFFMLTTLISLAIFIIGSAFDPGAKLSYEDLLTPVTYAACCVLPTFATYSRRELSAKEMLPRMLIEVAMIEAVMLFLAWRSPVIDTGRPSVILTISGSVFIINVLARIYSWLRDSARAREINADLRKFQQQEN